MGAGHLSGEIVKAEEKKVKYESRALREQLRAEHKLWKKGAKLALEKIEDTDTSALERTYAGQSGSAALPSVKTVTRKTDFTPLLMMGGLILILKGFK